MEWILHIDTDELVYPGGGPEYSIQRVLANVPADVDTIVFPNYESLPERDDVQDPFTEVGGRPLCCPVRVDHCGWHAELVKGKQGDPCGIDGWSGMGDL